MCGIVGFWDKSNDESAPLGRTILKMLDALDCRGPDSAGVALYGPPDNGDLVLKIKLGDHGPFERKSQQVTERAKTLGTVREAVATGPYLRLVLAYQDDPGQLDGLIEATDDEIEVVSLGRQLEIAKQVGSPRTLEASYGISAFAGSHGIGHTRLSTESKIDLSHSQPFWAHGCPDLAIVHNGHITNYHKLRTIYEQRGVRFFTENDSEVIGVYLADQLSEGKTLSEAMEASLDDLDGSFTYLVATEDAMGYARDPFALKPLITVETDDYVAIANEEVAIRSALGTDGVAHEPGGHVFRVWERTPAPLSAVA